MNRLEVSVDGKTAYERCKGKKAQVLGLEFGEKVLWKSPAGAEMEKINPRWGYGLFMGVRARSTELIIADRDTDGLKYVRTVRRVPLEQRWSVHNLTLSGFDELSKGTGVRKKKKRTVISLSSTSSKAQEGR